MEDTKYLSVSDINSLIKQIINKADNLKQVYLRGEISNFKDHTKGHLYFSLKDENSRINGMMFSFKAKSLNFKPENGMTVLVIGDISVYETTGSYNIIVSEMIPDGIGNLHIAFEQLKKQLASEGLFEDKYKQKIPKIPRRIGIITAPTGAAIKDIISTLKRRFPMAETLLFPALVQGEQAKYSIVDQIKLAQNYNLDVLIIGRGGGSIEDLWAFNEEIVARAIFNSKVPIISAVGHEIDFTISDFVADLRAPTPTAAAELAVPSRLDIIKYLAQVKIRLNESLNNKINYNRLLLNKLSNSYLLTNPVAIYDQKLQKLDNLNDKIQSIINNKLIQGRNILNKYATSYYLENPKQIYLNKKNDLNQLNNTLNNLTLNIYDKNNNLYQKLVSNLDLLNPLNSLKRGYAVIKQNGKAISSINNIDNEDKLIINLKDGNIITSVISKEEIIHE